MSELEPDRANIRAESQKNQQEHDMFRSLFAVGILGVAGAANGAVVYTYTANPFDQFYTQRYGGWSSDLPVTKLVITFEFDSLLPANFDGEISPLQTTWNDGVTALICDPSPCMSGAENHGAASLSVRTDSEGNIVAWLNIVGSHNPTFGSPHLMEMRSEYHWSTPSDPGQDSVTYWQAHINSCCTDNYARSSAVGSWRISGVPLPAAAWLFGGALGALAIVKRRAQT